MKSNWTFLKGKWIEESIFSFSIWNAFAEADLYCTVLFKFLISSLKLNVLNLQKTHVNPKIFNTELGTECVIISILHAVQNHSTSIISPKCTFSMALCVMLIIFLSQGCLNPTFGWNSVPNVMTRIIVKKQNCIRSVLAAYNW
jgi:hypothetical protein